MIKNNRVGKQKLMDQTQGELNFLKVISTSIGVAQSVKAKIYQRERMLEIRLERLAWEDTREQQKNEN